MTIPRTPLILNLAGLIPFVWGALTVLLPDLGHWAAQAVGPRFVGLYVMLSFGTVLLSFMGGALLGFVSRLPEDRATRGYIVSVLPMLWAFFMIGGGAMSSGLSLIAGFAVILVFDWWFWRQNAAPRWWMGIRLSLTAVVLTCLVIGLMLA